MLKNKYLMLKNYHHLIRGIINHKVYNLMIIKYPNMLKTIFILLEYII